MTSAVRWVLVAVLAAHGLIHLAGVAKGFGWAEVSQLGQPIGPAAGALWLLAALLVLASAVLVATGVRTWWAVAVGGVVVSQLAIASSWSDAKLGTVANLVLLVAAAYGFASVGPTSFEAQWLEGAAAALSRDARQAPSTLVTEADLDALPPPLAAYVRSSGAVGRPRVTNVYADFHGRIHSGPHEAWMPFTGKQLNTYGPRPSRLFIMNATRSGLPVTVLHSFKDSNATMRAKVLSVFTVVDAAGPVMDRGETVTVFNDLVVLAPGAIADAPVQWTAVDAHRVRGVYTDGHQTVSADLTFDPENHLVDFVSHDRARASADDRSFTAQGWSTPISRYRETDGGRVIAGGEGRWQAPPPEGTFSYVELSFDAVVPNVRSTDGSSG